MNFSTDYKFTWLGGVSCVVATFIAHSPLVMFALPLILLIESAHVAFNSYLRKVSKDESITTSFIVLKDRTENSLKLADDIIQKLQIRVNSLENKTANSGNEFE